MHLADESETEGLGAWLAAHVRAGEVVRLEGPLGAGKTTLARGLLRALGHVGPVRSPTFNLLHVYATTPPVVHADLYRVASAEGTGLEDYLDDHVALIEWSDRLGPDDPETEWLVTLCVDGDARRAEVRPPAGRSGEALPFPAPR